MGSFILPAVAPLLTVAVGEAAAYYLDARMRSSSEEQQKYCRPLRG